MSEPRTTEVRELADSLAGAVRGRIQTDAPLAGFTTYRVGGRADVLVEADDDAALVAVAELSRERGVPVAVVGRGSNLLVSDDGFAGVVVRLGPAYQTHERSEAGLVLGGGLYLPNAARITARLGLAGFEFAAEIPGSFGGAVRMNAGAHGRSMADVLCWADTTDLATARRQRLSVRDLGYAYRHSNLAPSAVVTRGEIRLEPGDPTRVSGRIAEHLRWRRENQPGGLSAGSVFKNPPGDAAGRLIDAAGLKGLRVGGAEVSAVHANFIVTRAGASAADVWQLIHRIREIVLDRLGVDLEPEIRFLGEFPQVNPNGEGKVEG